LSHTRACLRHEAVQFGTSQRAVVLWLRVGRYARTWWEVMAAFSGVRLRHLWADCRENARILTRPTAVLPLNIPVCVLNVKCRWLVTLHASYNFKARFLPVHDGYSWFPHVRPWPDTWTSTRFTSRITDLAC